MRMRLFTFFLFFVAFVWLPEVPGYAQSRINIDMTNLGKVWEAYIAAPGKDTAIKVYESLPGGKENREIELQVDVRDLIMKKLHVLESQIYAGERNALKVAFRMFVIADERMEEDLIKIIGYLLRFNTKLFLQELQEHEDLVPDLNRLVCSFLLSAPGDKAQQNLERNIRLKALGYVEDKQLKSIKKKCIKILKKVKI